MKNKPSINIVNNDKFNELLIDTCMVARDNITCIVNNIEVLNTTVAAELVSCVLTKNVEALALVASITIKEENAEE